MNDLNNHMHFNCNKTIGLKLINRAHFKNTMINSVLFLFIFSFTSFYALGQSYSNPKIIDLLHHYAQLNLEAKQAFESKNETKQKRLYAKIDSLHENHLLPQLNNIEKSYCQSNDINLLTAYCKMLGSSNGSCSEAIRTSFAVMYLCNSSQFLQAIKQNNYEEQLRKDLGFGFENLILSIDTSELNLDELRNRINSQK